MAVTKQDRWLLPGRQYELPGRDLLAAAALHARRESMFLVFATLILTATIALPFVSSGTVLDLGGALRLPQTAELTFGVAVFPVAILVSQLVCELYGSRRTYALGFAAVFASAALAALAFAADVLPLTAWPIALVAFGAAAHLSHAWVFAAMRRALQGHHLLGRSLLAMATSQVIGQAPPGLAAVQRGHRHTRFRIARSHFSSRGKSSPSPSRRGLTYRAVQMNCPIKSIAKVGHARLVRRRERTGFRGA